MTLKRAMGGIAVLAVILGAIVQVDALIHQARNGARRAQCLNNLKFIGLALANYHEVNGSFPPGTVANASLPTEKRLSWLVAIWPYVEATFFGFDEASPWDRGANTAVNGRDISWFLCPSDPARLPPNLPCPTHYVGIAGLGPDAPFLPTGHPRAGVFGYDRQTRRSDITDGASFTMSVAETTSRNGPWTAGGPATVRGVDPAHRPYLGRGRPFGGIHPGGTAVLFADGSVRVLRDAIDPRTFEKLSTIAGHEPIGPDEF